MYLTSREQALVSDIFRVLADALPGHETRREVGLRLLELLRADFFGSFVWDDGEQRYVNGVTVNLPADRVAAYEKHHQYHDTVMPRLHALRIAVRVSDVIPHEELRATAIYHDLLAHCGLYWGLNLSAWDGEVNVGDLRIWRAKEREDFAARELALLEMIRPALTASLARSRSTVSVAASVSGSAGAIHPANPALAVQSALAALTPREREVVDLVVEGLLDKEIAERLGISYTTVRTHLDRAFQKLGVSNRSRLARLIQSVAR